MAIKKMTQKALKELKAQIKNDLRNLGPYWIEDKSDVDSQIKKLNELVKLIDRITFYKNESGDTSFDFELSFLKPGISSRKKALGRQGVVVKQGKDGLFTRQLEEFWTKARKLPLRKNESLNEAMAAMVEASGMSLRQLAEFSGGDYQRMSAFLHDRECPITNGTWSDAARRLCMALGCIPEDIFPEKWWKKDKAKAHYAYTLEVHNTQSETFTHNAVNRRELLRALNRQLKTLTQREAEVIKYRFGFMTGKELSLEEVARIYNVTRERIRQLESFALRKLRHPDRIKHLLEFNPCQTPSYWHRESDFKPVDAQDLVECASCYTQLGCQKVPPYRLVEE